MYSLLLKEEKMPTGNRLHRPLYHGAGAPELLFSPPGWHQPASGSHRQQRSVELPAHGLSVKVMLGLLDPKSSKSIPRGQIIYHGSQGTALCMKSRSLLAT